MATTTKIFGFLLLVITTFMVLLGSCSSATVYKVGESDGWTAKDNTYYHWAELKEFHVGDSLVFEYNNNFNNVTQVSGVLEYQFCDSSFRKPSVYNTGYDVVTFTEPGYHYFISSNYTRCKSGQRLDVLVIQDSSSPIPPPLPSGKIYKVGESKGWSVYDSDFYYSWCKEKQLHIGDYLIFEYNNEVNDVLGISSDLEFLYCDPGSLVAVQKTSYVLVKLTKPGVHYFIN